MKKSVVLLASFIAIYIIHATAYSQVTQDWVSIYSVPGNKVDMLTAMAIDGAGNVYVTGYTYTGSYSYDEDFLTIKYNSSGALQWARIFKGTPDNSDKASAIAVDNQGGVYVTGSSMGSGNNDLDIVTLKYSSEGTQQWFQRYDIWGPDYPTSIVADESGFVYVSGGSNNTAVGNLIFTTIKYTSAGAQVWAVREPSVGWKVASMKVDGSGNVYITGPGWLGADNDYNYVTIKYDPAGAKQWGSFYNGPITTGDDESTSIDVDNSGNVFVTGNSDGGNTGEDYTTVKYNPAGQQLWSARYNGPVNSLDFAYCVRTDAAGNAIVTGRSTGSGSDYDYVTIKYGAAGAQQWLMRYNGAGNSSDEAKSLTLDESGNIYVTGSTYYSLQDFCTIKYNPAGVQQWVKTYDGPGGSVDVPVAIRVNTSGKIYVAGICVGNGTKQDYCTIRYSQPIGIQQISTEIPAVYSLSQNYPNPFNPSTTIKFDVAKTSIVKLTVYDVTGHIVSEIVNQQLKPGTYEIDWNASDYSSGIYFYRLTAGSLSETKKMILIK